MILNLEEFTNDPKLYLSQQYASTDFGPEQAMTDLHSTGRPGAAISAKSAAATVTGSQTDRSVTVHRIKAHRPLSHRSSADAISLHRAGHRDRTKIARRAACSVNYWRHEAPSRSGPRSDLRHPDTDLRGTT